MNRQALLSVILVCIAQLLSGCDKAPDIEKIEQNLADMQEAVENKEFTAIREHLHESFIANDRLDTTEVKRLLQMYSFRHQSIDVAVLASETMMDPTYSDRAETTASVVVTGSSGLLPSDGSARTVKIEWIKQSADWKVIKAEWRP